MDLDHMELGWNILAEATIRPITNVVFYCMPWLGACFSYCLEVRAGDLAQETMMPSAAKASILREVAQLTKAAKITQPVILYTSLKHTFASFGGALSLTAPALCVPYQHLFRTNKNAFTQESKQDNLAASLWNYSDDETSFLVARELGCIKNQSGLLRLATKISVLAVAGFFGGWAVAAVSFIAAHCLLESKLQQKMDLLGIDILSARFSNPKRANQAALHALQKMQHQNLFRLKHNSLCRFYITQAGDNLLDWTHPTLSSRIRCVCSAYLT